jgi:hypothetical protein
MVADMAFGTAGLRDRLRHLGRAVLPSLAGDSVTEKAESQNLHMVALGNQKGGEHDVESGRRVGLVAGKEPPCTYCEVHGGHTGQCPVIS